MTPHERLLDLETSRPSSIASVPRGDLLAALSKAPALAEELLASPDPSDRPDAAIVYRSVASILARALLDRDGPLFDDAIRSALRIYRIGDFRAGLALTPPAREASLWESLVIELFAVGGLAVEQRAWSSVRELTLQRPDPSSAHYVTWLRHGQVHSARGSLDPHDSLPHLAARRLIELHGSLSADDALTAVCRFDFLAALIVSEVEPGGAAYFPSFAACSDSLVEPVVVDELRDGSGELRQTVFHGDDKGLREALRTYNESAVAEAAYQRARTSDRPWEWRGFSDHRTWMFIRSGDQWEDWQ